MADKKCNAKSIRMTDTVYHYINSQKGDGFNEKFHNIIIDARETEKERLDRIRELDLLIKEKEQELQEVKNQIYDFNQAVKIAKVSISTKFNKVLSDLAEYT